MKRKSATKTVAAILCATMLLNMTGCQNGIEPQPSQETAKTQETQSTTVAEPTAEETKSDNVDVPSEKPRIQDDLYYHVNYDWLSTATIPEGKAQYGLSDELEERVNEALFEILEREAEPDSDLQKVKALYESYMDMEGRNAAGMDPVMPYFNQIQEVKTLADFTKLMCDETMFHFNYLIPIGVMADDMNSNENVVHIFPSTLSLDDAAEYQNMTENGQRHKELDDILMHKLLKKAGYSIEEAQKTIDQSFAFEKNMAEHMLTIEDAYAEDYQEKVYNPVTFKELQELEGEFPLTQAYAAVGAKYNGTYILREPAWLEQMKTLYTEDHLEEMKSYLTIVLLRQAAASLDLECRTALDEFDSEFYGIVGQESDEKRALEVCNNYLGEILGEEYVKKYFSEESRADVEAMTEKILTAFKAQIGQADWLTEETKEKAIEKADAITLNIGYPDKWKDYSDLVITSPADGGNPFENSLNISRKMWQFQVDKIGKPVNKAEWLMTPQTVNAYYSPDTNSINFPAGILQEPYYDPEASESTNIGAIGMVIGHELTHGFDNRGSLYNKEGNRINWWTEEEREKFNERTQRVKDFYSQIEILDDKFINGDLTCGENVADLGAMTCALAIMREMENPDYESFFEGWATIWQEISTEETVEYKLKYDVHSPKKARVNAVSQQFEEFYETFDVKLGDGMYVAPEERVKVW